MCYFLNIDHLSKIVERLFAGLESITCGLEVELSLMYDNKWLPQVLKDLEKSCHERGLPEVAFHVEEARRKFRQFQSEEISEILADSESVEPLKLVWSRPEKQV